MGKFTKDKRVNKFHSYSKTVGQLTTFRTSIIERQRKMGSEPGQHTSYCRLMRSMIYLMELKGLLIYVLHLDLGHSS